MLNLKLSEKKLLR